MVCSGPGHQRALSRRKWPSEDAASCPAALSLALLLPRQWGQTGLRQWTPGSAAASFHPSRVSWPLQEPDVETARRSLPWEGREHGAGAPLGAPDVEQSHVKGSRRSLLRPTFCDDKGCSSGGSLGKPRDDKAGRAQRRRGSPSSTLRENPLASCLGWPSGEDTATGFKVRLEGSSSQCQGRLQVYAQDSWSTVCAQSWGLQGSSPPGPGQASHLCRQLHCGDICRLGTVPAFNAPQPRLRQVICRGPPGSFSNCSSIRTQSWCQPLALVCLGGSGDTMTPNHQGTREARAPLGGAAPVQPGHFSPAPPRLRMVAGPGGLQCAGAIEFYSSHWGGAVGYEAREDESAGLGTLVCGNLGCGSFLKWLPEPQWTVVQWTVQDTSCEALPQCFRRALPGAASPALALVCSGPAAGSVGSIVLAVVLLAVLLVVCGPLAYRKLLKRVRQKKQRQWIGPTGMSQTMSFHRNPTATVRAQPENHPREHADNEYSQPPRNSRLSAYPALEGALRLSAAQPDNSSDSDYDLHATHRL
ncbi:T-cell surface glycoprotein CD5 [Fukomys damarensis]|uniref:T-cell surface glycoprotein CD5 n=1 Tax=Fukomys damarensis TaxID=885580 RepID=UPI00145565D1|nr:T-cell surface glycoprotein CD5 [Fukomys damarensis]